MAAFSNQSVVPLALLFIAFSVLQNPRILASSSSSFSYSIIEGASCEEDLNGTGSFDSLCVLNTSVGLENDLYIRGKGDLRVEPGVSLSCLIAGCVIDVNISGSLELGKSSSIVAGTVVVGAANASLDEGALINCTGLGGKPPDQTSGTPLGVDGAGGGHGGRGACCVKDDRKLPEDVWGGDAYSWSTLAEPWSYGSKGGTMSKEVDTGGGGGGRIKIIIEDILDVNGNICADGGDASLTGGGGSGGSIILKAYKMYFFSTQFISIIFRSCSIFVF